jgi:Beta-ketoacyl synthase, N-terminal domain
MFMNLFVLGIGVIGPGLEDWPAARAILAGTRPHVLRPTAQPVPHILPTTERRRSSEVVRLAIKVADEALTMSGLPRHEIGTVFASSDGDGIITHQICESLAGSERDVSPTLFHNSVNNAPAGYWSIASESQANSTSLCAYDSSFAAGLFEAGVQVTVEQQAMLLVGYDVPFPNPLRAVRTVDYSFAAAFVLAPRPWGVPIMRWQVRLEPPRLPTKIPAAIDFALHNNPSARCLPLLVAMASRQAQSVSLDYLHDHSLVVICEP